MTDYIFGANILENLTTGMYKDSKVIYREYIQNSCDQIDSAMQEGILKSDEGSIKIWLDRDQRTIIIEDNATGIPATSFQQTLGNIADSDKKIGEDKGFRGIGRLCGLAYCKTLIFKSSYKGEDIISTMVCDAKKMRELIEENERGIKHTANEILQNINKFEQTKTDDLNSHFFRVELIDINQENTDLLDFQQVKDYLSFIAPVPYQNSFIFRSVIYQHAENIGKPLDEYKITLEGEQIFKKYTTTLKEASGIRYDEIFDVHIKDFYNKKGQLFAWMWIGLSKFQKAIPKINQMRGIRLRKENIQIGGEDSLQKLFREDRGNNYFVGELFAINSELIPNSQRDYFNENLTRTEFEKELNKYFNDDLYKVYRDASTVNSSTKIIHSYEYKWEEFNKKENDGGFVNGEHREREFLAVREKKKEADIALNRIKKIKDKAPYLVQKVIERVETDTPISSLIEKPDLKENVSLHRTDKLTKYSKKERKLISKIFSLILESTDSETAEIIISRIEKDLQ
jgi:molecular chaperone HtpG